MGKMTKKIKERTRTKIKRKGVSIQKLLISYISVFDTLHCKFILLLFPIDVCQNKVLDFSFPDYKTYSLLANLFDENLPVN